MRSLHSPQELLTSSIPSLNGLFRIIFMPQMDHHITQFPSKMIFILLTFQLKRRTKILLRIFANGQEIGSATPIVDRWGIDRHPVIIHQSASRTIRTEDDDIHTLFTYQIKKDGGFLFKSRQPLFFFLGPQLVLQITDQFHHIFV